MLLRFLLISATAWLAMACSSSSQGNVSCTEQDGCDAKPVFARGLLSATLVTSDAVYAAEELSCAVYAADKPVTKARQLATNACNVNAFARTSRGLFWTTNPPPTSKDPMPKGSLVWFGETAASPTVIDSTLDHPGQLVAVGESLYIGVADGIFQLAPDATKLTRTLTTIEPVIALKTHAGALYWHDGFASISTWRPGDRDPTHLVSDQSLARFFEFSIDAERSFAVDASGIYWLRRTSAGKELAHAPLAGGMPEKLLDVGGEPRVLTLDDDAVYWVEADAPLVVSKTTIRRAAKSALRTATTVATTTGDSRGLQSTPEGLYISADPSLTDLDVQKLGFKRYAGPLLFLPRGVLGDSR